MICDAQTVFTQGSVTGSSNTFLHILHSIRLSITSFKLNFIKYKDYYFINKSLFYNHLPCMN
jgi:hypothetical protein